MQADALPVEKSRKSLRFAVSIDETNWLYEKASDSGSEK
jgi:hypothetical protein